MTGIGERLSSGMQCGNQALISYTGRGLPKNMDQLKNNVSKNLQSCAKLCSAFLDSSLGMAVSMGVLGLATASVCLQEDIEFANLCFRRSDHPIKDEYPQISSVKDEMYHKKNWTLGTYSVCQMQEELSDNDTFCVTSTEYQEQYPYVSLFQCASNITSGFLQYVFFERKDNRTIISETTDCMGEGAYEAIKALANSQNQSSLMPNEYDFQCQAPSAFCSLSSNTSGVYCWNKKPALQAAFPQFFVDTTNCFKSTPRTVDEGCSPCNSLMLAFGIGSAAVLIATVGKVIYNQCKASCSKKSKKNSKNSNRLAVLMLEDGLLLGASSLGTGVLMVSLLPPCGPVHASTKKMVVLSTTLYGLSAVSRLLMNCITSPITEDPTSKEDQIVELPMLEGGTSEVDASGATNDEGGEDSIIPVIVVVDNP